MKLGIIGGSGLDDPKILQNYEEKEVNIEIINKGGFNGLEEYAPYDRILVSASADKMPEHLFDQLKDNGVMVAPVENSIFQIIKFNGKIIEKEFCGFKFVPLIED